MSENVSLVWTEGTYLAKQSRGTQRVYHVVHVLPNGDAVAWYKLNLTESGADVLPAADREKYRIPIPVVEMVNVTW